MFAKIKKIVRLLGKNPWEFSNSQVLLWGFGGLKARPLEPLAEKTSLSAVISLMFANYINFIYLTECLDARAEEKPLLTATWQ